MCDTQYNPYDSIEEWCESYCPGAEIAPLFCGS